MSLVPRGELASEEPKPRLNFQLEEARKATTSGGTSGVHEPGGKEAGGPRSLGMGGSLQGDGKAEESEVGTLVRFEHWVTLCLTAGRTPAVGSSFPG